MSGSLIELENISENIVVFHMKDEKNKNTFTEDFIKEFLEKIEKINQLKNVKAVIFRGLDSIFCAGASKEELQKLIAGEVTVKDLVLSEKIIEIPVPTIACMEGGAVGGGLVVGLCCDIVLMAERSMYGGGFTDLGFTPGMGFTRLLQGLTGEYFANEILYTGKLYKGKVFAEKSLVNYVLPKEELFSKALELAKVISEKPLKTLKVLKYSVNLKKRQVLQEARVHEDFMHSITFNSPEVQQRIKENYFSGIN